MTPITPPHVLAARTAFLALEVESWSKTQTTYREQGERNTYKLIDGYKLIQNPTPFEMMVRVVAVFKMTPSQLKEYDDLFIADYLSDLAFRVDVHMATFKKERDDGGSDRLVDYDFELDASNLDRFMNESHRITSHPYFDSMWKEADAQVRDEIKADCHTVPYENHGCGCLKHMTAWKQKLMLLCCRTCKPGPSVPGPSNVTTKEEEEEEKEEEGEQEKDEEEGEESQMQMED